MQVLLLSQGLIVAALALFTGKNLYKLCGILICMAKNLS